MICDTPPAIVSSSAAFAGQSLVVDWTTTGTGTTGPWPWPNGDWQTAPVIPNVAPLALDLGPPVETDTERALREEVEALRRLLYDKVKQTPAPELPPKPTERIPTRAIR